MKTCLSFQYVVFTDTFLQAICIVSLSLRVHCSMHVSAGVSPCGSSRCFGALHSKAAGNHFKKKEGVMDYK